MAKKPSMGRKKIKIQKIEVKNHLQVTFSKRRSGLIKKASELCTLCGVDAAIVVFSPAGKVFSFGHPSVEFIMDKFLSQRPSHNTNDPFHLVEAQRNESIRDLNARLGQYINELELQRKMGENLDSVKKMWQSKYWYWEASLDKLWLGQLDWLKNRMEDLKMRASQHVTKMMMNPSPMGYVGNGVLDQYEAQSSLQAIMGGNVIASGNDGFGYCHGFF